MIELYFHIKLYFAQVVVTVNGIPGSCSSRNCTFNYIDPPKITSISPTSGPGGPSGIGTEVTIRGSGFAVKNELNEVTIGGAKCIVLTSADDSITCRAGKKIGDLLCCINIFLQYYQIL